MGESLFENPTGNRDVGNPARMQSLYVLGTFAVVLFTAYVPLLIGRYVFVEWYGDWGTSKSDFWLCLVIPLLQSFLMLVCPVSAGRINPRLAGFDITWVRWKVSEFVWIVLLVVITVLSGAAVSSLIKKLGLPVTDLRVFKACAQTSTLYLFALAFRIAVVGPVAEEIFWRGYAQTTLGKVFGLRKGLFFQAILFALLHFRPIGGFFTVFLYGMIFGIWRHRKKTLLPVIIAHVAVNSLYCLNYVGVNKINIKTDYVALFREVSRPINYDPNNNAAGYYREAQRLYVEKPDRLIEADIKAWPEELAEEKQVLLGNWVLANNGALEQLAAGVQMPYYWHEYRAWSMSGLVMPELKCVTRLASVLCSRAKLKATKGDLKGGFSDVLACYRLSFHFGGCKTLLEQLVGIHLRTRSKETAFQIIQMQKPSSDLLREAQEQFEILSSQERYGLDFTSEKFYVYDCVQRIFTDDGKGGGFIPRIIAEQMENPPRFLKSLLRDAAEERNPGWAKLERRQTTKTADRLFEYLEKVGRKSAAELHSEGKDIQTVIEEVAQENPLLRIFAPAYTSVVALDIRTWCRTEALITTLGLTRWKTERGDLPDTLQELVRAGYLKTLPTDPYSGGPLVYRRVGGDFVLYSFGADFDDDGGAESKWGEGEQGGDQVFWPCSHRK